MIPDIMQMFSRLVIYACVLFFIANNTLFPSQLFQFVESRFVTQKVQFHKTPISGRTKTNFFLSLTAPLIFAYSRELFMSHLFTFTDHQSRNPLDKPVGELRDIKEKSFVVFRETIVQGLCLFLFFPKTISLRKPQQFCSLPPLEEAHHAAIKSVT